MLFRNNVNVKHFLIDRYDQSVRTGGILKIWPEMRLPEISQRNAANFKQNMTLT